MTADKPAQPVFDAELIAEHKALCLAASEGPWLKGETHTNDSFLSIEEYGIAYVGTGGDKGYNFCVRENIRQRDASFIAQARTLLPQYIAEVERLQASLEQTRVQLAGCGCAALGYGGDCKQGDYGWSASFGDVVRMRERLRLAEAVCEAVNLQAEYGTGLQMPVMNALAAWKESRDQPSPSGEKET